MVVQALAQADAGGLRPVPQPAEGVTYAHKIEKAESSVDWSRTATEIGRCIRAFDPFPGACTALGAEVIKLWSYEIDSYKRPADVRCGEIIAVNPDGVSVACGENALRLTVLQRAGGKRLPAADFVRGFELRPGMVLGEPPAALAGV
jgi:methionyl-tRNA formyltransferase